MGAKKEVQEEIPEYVSTTWIGRKVSKNAVTIRREIKAGRLKSGYFNGDYAIKYSDYLEWKAKYFKPMAS